jgi:hypothetical protein
MATRVLRGVPFASPPWRRPADGSLFYDERLETYLVHHGDIAAAMGANPATVIRKLRNHAGYYEAPPIGINTMRHFITVERLIDFLAAHSDMSPDAAIEAVNALRAACQGGGEWRTQHEEQQAMAKEREDRKKKRPATDDASGARAVRRSREAPPPPPPAPAAPPVVIEEPPPPPQAPAAAAPAAPAAAVVDAAAMATLHEVRNNIYTALGTVTAHALGLFRRTREFDDLVREEARRAAERWMADKADAMRAHLDQAIRASIEANIRREETDRIHYEVMSAYPQLPRADPHQQQQQQQQQQPVDEPPPMAATPDFFDDMLAESAAKVSGK